MTGTACQHCGVMVAAGARFCANCGADVSAEQGNVATRKFTATQAMHDQLLARLRHAALGEHEVLTELGRGGMATVYLAHDIQLDRKVAIKVMLPSLLEGEDMVERFRLEARTAAQLSHPHIIPIYAVRATEGLVYFVMKFVEGRPLDAIIREVGQLPVPMVRSILSKVGEALGYAHRRGVVHRDIKPANLMIDIEGLPVVTDFGIAKVADARALTMTGAMIGTPTYMSPEQCSGGDITGASDQYSLGIVAYQMITGRVPFEGDTLVGLLYKHVHDAPEPILAARPDCPPPLAAAVMRMLAKDPAQRFPTMEAAVESIGTVSLSYDHPIRSQLIELAKLGENVAALKRISTPSSPIPLGARRTPGTSASGASGTAATTPASSGARGAGQTRELPVDAATPASSGSPTSPSPSRRSTGAIAAVALVVVAGVSAWLWQGQRASASGPQAGSDSTPPMAPALQSVGGGTAGTSDTARVPVVGAPAGASTSGPAVTGRDGAVTPNAATRPPAPAAVAAIRIEQTRSTLTVGDALTLRATPVDAGGSALAGRDVRWSSGDPSRATISPQGDVTARAPGDVTFTARSGSVSQHVSMRIERARAASVTVSRVPELRVGATARLTANAFDASNRPVSGDVRWRSADPRIASVDDGVVTAVAAGTTEIVVSIDGREASTPVTVTAPAPAPATPPRAEPAPDPRAEIEAAIARYARAVESKQLSSIRAAYPGLAADGEARLMQTLGFMDNLRADLRVTAVNVVGDQGTARIDGTYAFVNRDSRRNEQIAFKVIATLLRGPTGWQIQSIRDQ